MATLGLDDQRATYFAGRATLCAGPDDLERYDQVFEAYFNGTRRAAAPAAAADHVEPAPRAGLPTSEDGTGADDEPEDVVRAMASADRGAPAPRRRRAERRRRSSGWPRCSRPCARGAPLRRTARHQPWHRGDVDASRTLRASLRRMGEPGDIAWRRRGTRPRRVVLLIDVSGSMSGYADALLRLAHRFTQSRDGRSSRGRVETFTLGTRLTHLTRAMRVRDPERALVAAGATVPDWSGGTRLGETLKFFLDRWGQRGLARGAVVVVFSDGWERGDPAAAGRADGAAAPDRAPGRVGQPAPRQDRLRAGPAGRGRRPAATSTTSSPATRWRRSPSWRSWCPVREVLPELLKWWRDGQTVGVGTVVATFQSAPRPAGASMLVGPDGSAVGSVSGGCVEGAVYELAQEVVGDGTPVLERYGVSDDEAFAVGLTCGGILDVFVEKVNQETFPELDEIADDIESGRPVAVATVIEHPDPTWLGRRLIVRPGGDSPRRFGCRRPSSNRNVADYRGRSDRQRADDAVRDDTFGLLALGHNAMLTYGPDGERRGEGMRVFVWAFAPKPRMLVFGAIDFAAAVARVGAFLGYHVTVCDARPVFATATRFPEADEVVVDWPHRYLDAEVEEGRIDRRTVISVLTHDPKFDVPLLEVALRLPEVAYVGAMGSRRTHDDRLERLREEGLGAEEIGPAVQSPIGLDLGARTPGGDRDQHRRGDHRRPVGRLRRAAGRHRRPDPPRRRSGIG